MDTLSLCSDNKYKDVYATACDLFNSSQAESISHSLIFRFIKTTTL